MDDSLAALEARVGHVFSDRVLLGRALTHKSRAFEDGASGAETYSNNEQLEFLGDSVLGFLVSEALVRKFPEFPEGRLSKCKAHFVSADHLFAVALKLDLGAHLLLGKGEELSGGRGKRALLADALEALIAAIYLDAGLDAARAFVSCHVVGGVDGDCPRIDGAADHKSALQEWTQARKMPMPRYRIVATRGPEHAKLFVVEAQVGEVWKERAEGSSKKLAGQRAACALLARLESADG